MGPVEKMALLVATEGNRVSKGATARDSTQDGCSPGAEPRGKEPHRQRWTHRRSVRFSPTMLPFSIQRDGVFVRKEVQSSGGACVCEMDFLHRLKGQRIVNVSMELRLPKLPNAIIKLKARLGWKAAETLMQDAAGQQEDKW